MHINLAFIKNKLNAFYISIELSQSENSESDV